MFATPKHKPLDMTKQIMALNNNIFNYFLIIFKLFWTCWCLDEWNTIDGHVFIVKMGMTQNRGYLW